MAAFEFDLRQFDRQIRVVRLLFLAAFLPFSLQSAVGRLRRFLNQLPADKRHNRRLRGLRRGLRLGDGSGRHLAV